MATQPFGEHLKEAREAARLSQFDLARLTGIAQCQISAIETGTRDPSWKEAVALIEACGGTITIQKAKAASLAVTKTGR